MWTLAQILAELQKQTQMLQDMQNIERQLATVNASLSQIVKLLTPPSVAGVKIVFGKPVHK